MREKKLIMLLNSEECLFSTGTHDDDWLFQGPNKLPIRASHLFDEISLLQHLWFDLYAEKSPCDYVIFSTRYKLP